MTVKLTIDRYPQHGFLAVCICDEDGGVRLTPSKCCGRWDQVEAWSLDANDWRKIARLAEEAAESVGQTKESSDAI